MKIPDTGVTLKGISLAILEFTTTAPTLTPLHVKILCAIHVVLDQAILTKDIKDTNQGPLAPSSNCVARLEDILECQESQVAILSNLANEIKGSIIKTTESLEKAAEEAHATLKNIAALPPLTTTTCTHHNTSYADALKMGTPTQHAVVLVQSEAQSRQVIIKSESPSLLDLTELVMKANLAIEGMEMFADSPPPKVLIISTRKL